MGAGLLAKAVCQPVHPLLHYRFRRQASSHIQACASLAASALACRATSVTAVLSTTCPASGPMANSRGLTWPLASSTAPHASAAIPSANGPGWTNPRLSNCCGKAGPPGASRIRCRWN